MSRKGTSKAKFLELESDKYFSYEDGLAQPWRRCEAGRQVTDQITFMAALARCYMLCLCKHLKNKMPRAIFVGVVITVIRSLFHPLIFLLYFKEYCSHHKVGVIVSCEMLIKFLLVKSWETGFGWSKEDVCELSVA